MHRHLAVSLGSINRLFAFNSTKRLRLIPSSMEFCPTDHPITLTARTKQTKRRILSQGMGSYMRTTAPSRFQPRPVLPRLLRAATSGDIHLQRVRPFSTIITRIPIGITLIYITTTTRTGLTRHTGATNRVSSPPRRLRLMTLISTCC